MSTSPPSLSFAPSLSSAPSAFLENAFSLKLTVDPVMNFTNTDGEVDLTYSYFTEPAKVPLVTIWPYDDCGGRTSGGSFSDEAIVEGNHESSTSTHDGNNVTNYKTVFDVKTDKLASSDLFAYMDDTNTSAYFAFCARVDLNLTGVGSVSFIESQLNFTLNMTLGIDNIEVAALTYDAPDEKDTDAVMDFGLDAYQCEEKGGEYERITSPSPIAQNSKIGFCVAPNADSAAKLNVKDIITLDLKQEGSDAYNVIQNSAAASSALTTKTSVNDDKVVYVETFLISRFFQDGSESTPVSADGTALIEFDTTPSRRLEERLRNSNAMSDKEGGEQTGSFSFNFNLVSPTATAAETSSEKGFFKESTAMIAIVGLAVVVVAVVALIVTKKGKKNKGRMPK